MVRATFECNPGLFANLGFECFWSREDNGDPQDHLGYFAGDFNEGTPGAVGNTLRKHDFDGHWQSIDWILAARPARIVRGRSIRFAEQTIPPSDHQAVIGYLVFDDQAP